MKINILYDLSHTIFLLDIRLYKNGQMTFINAASSMNEEKVMY